MLFTFHYVSISTLSMIRLPDYRKHLHSTMYLFQHFSYSFNSSKEYYLHSTMYLFQRQARVHLYNFLIYLHSTMYLFQRLIRLYILILHYNLHSTMYLFQLITEHSRNGRMPIYIPLCIYFNHIHVINFRIYEKHLHSTMYLF